MEPVELTNTRISTSCAQKSPRPRLVTELHALSLLIATCTTSSWNSCKFSWIHTVNLVVVVVV